MHIDEDVLPSVRNALLESHKDKIEFHKKQIDTLNGQKTKLENRLQQIYIDKVDGKVTEEFYTEMTEKWQDELNKIKDTIIRHDNSDSNYLSQGVHILELCNKAHELYLHRTPAKRAKLLNCILSNCTLNDVSLSPTYRKPFDLIVKGLSRTEWLRPHRQFPNFSVEIMLGMSYVRKGDRWSILY